MTSLGLFSMYATVNVGKESSRRGWLNPKFPTRTIHIRKEHFLLSKLDHGESVSVQLIS